MSHSYYPATPSILYYLGRPRFGMMKQAGLSGPDAVKPQALIGELIVNRLVLAIIAAVAVPGVGAQNTLQTNPPTAGSAVAKATGRSGATCPWPANMDAVEAAPEIHQVIFENEHVRVLQVTIPPHSKEPIHAHCLPSTLYVQQAGDIIDRDDKGKILFDSRQLEVKPKAPFVQWSPPQAPHSVENLDDSPMKLIRIENKD